MSRRLQQLLFWAPRFLALCGVFFLALFAFDVFGLRLGFWGAVAAFLRHLIPPALLLLALLLAWRWPALGGLLFPALALLYVLWAREPWTNAIFIAGPLLLIGALFLLEWIVHNRGEGHEGKG